MNALFALALGLSTYAVSPITPLIMDGYAINRGTASFLTSLVFLTHVLFSIPAGILMRKLGPKWQISLGWAAAATPCLSFLSGNYYFLLTTRFFFGLSGALSIPCWGTLTMQWFRPRELPIINGIIMMMLTIGIAISSFAVVPLSEIFRWEITLSLFAVLPLACFPIWLVLGREHQSFVQTERRLSLLEAWKTLRSRNTLLLAIADAGPYALLTAAIAWLPSFYHEVHGMSLVKAGSLMGLLSVAGVLALISASFLAVRIQRRRPLLIIPGILAGFAGLSTFLLADTAIVYVAIFTLGFTCSFYLPILFTIPMELPNSNPNQVAIRFGALISFGSIFTFISPFTVGVTTDLLGSYIPSLTLFSVLSWSLPVAGALLPETGNPSLRKQ